MIPLRMAFFGLILSAPLALATETPDDIAGRIVAEVDGHRFDLPMLDSDLTVSITGDMATVEVTQEFANPSLVPVQAEYLFPLNQNAAIYAMEMRVGDEVVQAVIQEKQQAQATFDKAASEGKAAALLTQHRPNMFTQHVANLMPDLPVTVTLRYVQMVPKIDGAHELVLPLIVGPRYEGAPAADAVEVDDDAGVELVSGWAIDPVPAYPQVAGLDLPDTIADDRVSLDLSLTGGVSVSGFGSQTHALTIEESDAGLTARFADGKVMDNKDLVIRYALGGAELETAGMVHKDARGQFVSLMIEPPKLPNPDQIVPRELIFVLDTSGSMGGEPMNASKRFMASALKGLRPEDYFRIIPFANTARRFSNDAKPATPSNVNAGLRFVRKLNTGGGTEIDNAIRTAFATRQPENTLRIVVFLSDGYIGDEASVLRTIRNQIGAARIYAFGVGTSVNRYLLDSMAEEGRGYARYVGLDENALEVAEGLAADLKSPLLTDIEIDWGDMKVSDVTPERLPDLFVGSSLRVYARHDGLGSGAIKIKGLAQGRRAELPVALTPSTEGAEHDAALPLIWARTRIADMERRMAVRDNPDAADAEITRLGLKYSLQTRNTSFVAVSKQVVNDSGELAPKKSVPLPQVSGVSAEAYPQNGFSGSSSPEPEAIFGMLLVAAMAAMRVFGLRRRDA